MSKTFKLPLWQASLDVAGIFFLAPAELLAQEIEAGLKTIYLSTDYALTTHKSELVESNDTGSSIRYGLGFNVGDQKQLGVVLLTE